jgi:peptidoglycan hydrolase CwlO-like protein
MFIPIKGTQMTRIEINAELTKLRFEREKAQREVDNIQACMNELMRKRNELDRQLEVEEMGTLFDQMFGG